MQTYAVDIPAAVASNNVHFDSARKIETQEHEETMSNINFAAGMATPGGSSNARNPLDDYPSHDGSTEHIANLEICTNPTEIEIVNSPLGVNPTYLN